MAEIEPRLIEAMDDEPWLAFKARDLDAIVEGWANDCLTNSALSQSTPAYNYVRSVLAELKRRLTAATPPGVADAAMPGVAADASLAPKE